jgi:hypothetical protein
MVKQRYVGLTRAEDAFAALKPFRAELIRMKSQCRPFGADYLILEAVREALDTAAFHFTRDPTFYSLRPQAPQQP